MSLRDIALWEPLTERAKYVYVAQKMDNRNQKFSHSMDDVMCFRAICRCVNWKDFGIESKSLPHLNYFFRGYLCHSNKLKRVTQVLNSRVSQVPTSCNIIINKYIIIIYSEVEESLFVTITIRCSVFGISDFSS